MTLKERLFHPATRQKLLGFASLLALMVFFTAASPNFLQTDNLVAILQATAVNGVLAIACTFVIITAGIDLSVGAVVGFSTVIIAWLLTHDFPIWAAIVITLGIFLLIFSRTAVVGAKAIKNLSLIALLLFFEFINLLLHPFLDRITNHSPILMLLCMAAIAGLLIPLHHRMEKLITNMLVSKNNRVRLEAARKTIEELEGAGKSDQADH